MNSSMSATKMHPQKIPHKSLHWQKGIGLAAAIFVITLLAIIALTINRLVEQNAQTFVEEINLTRAFYAAETGAGFTMNSLYPPEDYSSYSNLPDNCADWGAGETFPRVYTLTVDGLNQCTATVDCSDKEVSSVIYTTIESTGACGDVERTIQVRTGYDKP